MNILLIQVAGAETAIGEDLYLHEPLALEYVGAGVSTRHRVKLLDMRLEKDLSTVLRDFKPEIVGLGGYTLHVSNIKKVSRIIKEFDPRILVVVGGHHATILPHDFQVPGIDIVVIGEGVFTFREIVDHFESKRNFSSIRGIAVNDGGRLTFTEPKEYPNLDDIPFPDRSLTQHLRHLYFSEWFQPVASLRTSKGCAFQCNFCSLWKESKRNYLTRAPGALVEELKGIAESFVFFADDETFLDIKRMERFADLIAQEGIKKEYFMYARSDTVVRHPRLFEKWRDIGLVRVLIGLESHREKDLQRYNKKTTLEMNEEAVKILHRLGVSIYAAFIVNPDFEERDFDDLSKYVRNFGLETPYFSVLTPLPGSELFEQSKGLETIGDYDLFDFCHAVLPTRLPLERFYRELYYVYMKSGMVKERKYSPKTLSRQMLVRYQNILAKVRVAYRHHKIEENTASEGTARNKQGV